MDVFCQINDSPDNDVLYLRSSTRLYLTLTAWEIWRGAFPQRGPRGVSSGVVSDRGHAQHPATSAGEGHVLRRPGSDAALHGGLGPVQDPHLPRLRG